jgi:hypothetical protein
MRRKKETAARIISAKGGAPMTATTDTQWLHDCGWRGWFKDSIKGKIVTHHGDVFASAAALRAWLESLPTWPKVRNIPKREVHP